MASANPALLPKHEGYPMKNSGSPVTGPGEETGAAAWGGVADGSGGIAALAGECHAVGRIAAAPTTMAATAPVVNVALVLASAIALNLHNQQEPDGCAN